MNGEDSGPTDVWASGNAYEPYVGRWSRVVAREFLRWLGVLPQSRWLDVGCGTGALTQTILQFANPAAVKGIDASPAYAAFAHAHLRDDRVQFEVGDAQALPVESAVYDVVVSGLMLNFVPKPQVAVSEMVRATRLGGVAGVYVWDYAGEVQFMRHFWDAAVALNPAAFQLDEGRRFPICHPDVLTEHFQRAGLVDVGVRALDVPTVFKDFDDYWTPFLGGQGPAPGYAMSLADADRLALRERLRMSLPIAADGSIPLIARAWAVRGTREHH